MRSRFFALALLAACGATSPSPAQTLAFTPNGPGVLQPYHTSLGLFFNLNQSLTVAAVGYWDDNLDGLNTTLSVALFNATTGDLVIGTEQDFSGTIGTLFGPAVANEDSTGRPGQFRLLNLTAPITLPAGDYALVAWGYNFFNEILNSASTSPPAANAVSVDTFGGVLDFVEARYDDTPGVLPATFDSYLPQYASATFSTTAISAVPEPAAWALAAGASVILGGAVLRRRRAA